MESANEAGQKMSLAALQHYDPYIVKLLDVTGQVALYTFSSKANEWEKTEIEGTLFVYARSASPRHGFTIMNRLSTDNLVEPITTELEFQLQEPFLLYRNSHLGIYSIWFYDKLDCRRIAQLMLRIVKQEAAQASPDESLSRGADILQLLSQAREQYQRSRMINRKVEERDEESAAQPEQCVLGVKQITVEELFGSIRPLAPAHLSSDPAPLSSLLRVAAPPDAPLVTPQSFQASGPGVALSKDALVRPCVAGAEPVLLLSPSVFQNAVTTATETPSPPTTDDTPQAVNRTQLQDTLVHLLKNDAGFLSVIHDSYVQSVSKGVCSGRGADLQDTRSCRRH